MGHWNETCCISNLPILSGDDVVVFILEANHSQSIPYEPRPCYVGANYTPLYTAIRGEYDEYGSIENIKGQNQLIAYLNNLEISTGTHKCKDVSTKIFTPDTITDDIGDFTPAKYFLPNYKKERGYLACLFVHASLYDLLVSKVGERTPYEREQPISTFYAADIESKLQEAYTEYQDAIQSKPSQYAELIFSRAFESAFKGICSNHVHTLALSYCEGHYPGFAKEFLDLMLFTKALTLLRKGWLSFSGIGGQGEELQLHKNLAEYVLNQIAERKRNWEENYGDEGVEMELADTLHWFD